MSVAFGFVLILLLLANGAARERRRNGALHEVIEVQGLSSSTLKDRADCELPHALPVSSECVCQLLHRIAAFPPIRKLLLDPSDSVPHTKPYASPRDGG
jgi:hypothetical protein